MHFATLTPDWNSLDSVRRAHSFLEGAALVFFALLVICEALAHLSDDKKTERRFDKIGIVFFAIAVLAEIVAYPYGQRNDTLSAQVIGSLDAKSREASSNASSALTKSSEADTKADAAETKSGKAVTESSSAMTIASGARKEADSFEQDIKSAKQNAADAESHLADALERTARDEKALDELQQKLRIRHLSDEEKSEIRDCLKNTPPHEVRISAVMSVPDGAEFGADLANAINSTGWRASYTGWEASGSEVRGLGLLTRDFNNPPPGTKELKTALECARLPVTIWTVPPTWGGGVQLGVSMLVGKKD